MPIRRRSYSHGTHSSSRTTSCRRQSSVINGQGQIPGRVRLFCCGNGVEMLAVSITEAAEDCAVSLRPVEKLYYKVAFEAVRTWRALSGAGYNGQFLSQLQFIINVGISREKLLGLVILLA